MRVIVGRPDAFITDAEVFQELLHRYMSIRAWERGRLAFEGFALAMEGRVEAVSLGDVQAAQQWLHRAGLWMLGTSSTPPSWVASECDT